MTEKQREVLNRLAVALAEATDCGLFDEIAIHIHPDTINTFCDAIGASAELER